MDAAERRRVPRLSLVSELFRVSSINQVFPIVDLSLSGMAFRLVGIEDPSELALFSVGAEVVGTLNLKREKYPLQVRVRHLRTDLVGCEFERLSDATGRALTDFLDPANLGKDLKPIPMSESGWSQPLGCLWYHGASGTDLLLWREWDGQYSKILLCMLGSYVQWEEEKLVTGRFRPSHEEASQERGMIYFDTMLFESDAKPDSGKLSVAKTLILSSNLPQNLKSWCTRKLS